MNFTKNYKVYIDGAFLPLEAMRVSKMPFNRHWPGHQRALDQTEVTAFASFEIEKSVKVKIECDFDFKDVCVKPASLGINPEIENGAVSFTLDKPCKAIVEFDGTLGALHLFADPPEKKPELKDGDIYFAPGEHDVGKITLKSGQTVYIAKGAVVYGEIYGEDVENVTIAGRGILDHDRAKIEAGESNKDDIDPLRPSPILIRYSKNVVIRDIVVRNSCFLSVRPVCCEDLLIDNIKVLGCWKYNSDGIDMLCCRRAAVRNCFVRSFDDSLCVKGFCFIYQGEMFYKGRTYDMSEDILVENCVIWNEWGNALHIGIDLCAKAVKNCTFRSCDIIHAAASFLNVSTVDYAEIYDILYDDIRVEYDAVTQMPQIQETENSVFEFNPQSKFAPYLFLLRIYFDKYSFGGKVRGKLHDVTFKNISVSAPKMPPSLLEGYSEDNCVRDITFETITINGKRLDAYEEFNFENRGHVYGISIK